VNAISRITVCTHDLRRTLHVTIGFAMPALGRAKSAGNSNTPEQKEAYTADLPSIRQLGYTGAVLGTAVVLEERRALVPSVQSSARRPHCSVTCERAAYIEDVFIAGDVVYCFCAWPFPGVEFDAYAEPLPAMSQ
jgi:hypothetical protein